MGAWPEGIEPFGRIGGLDAVDRLMDGVLRHSRSVYEGTGVEPPSVAQVGMVLRALADHTAMMHAIGWAPEPGGFWPEATSVGRWMHAYANACEHRVHGWTTSETPEHLEPEPPRSVPAAWPTAQAALLVVTGDDDAGLEPMLVALRQDDVDVDGSPTPLRVYDHALRDEVADAMRRFTAHDAPGWIGPEVAIGAVERHLLAHLLPTLNPEDRMTDQATTTEATETAHDVTSSPVPRRTVGPLEVVVTNLVPASTADVKWAMEQLTEHAPEVDAVRVAPDVWEALHAVLDGETAGDAATAGPRVTVDNLLHPGTWAADVAPLVAANTVTETGPATDPEATTV